jgi:hypothetical protein
VPNDHGPRAAANQKGARTVCLRTQMVQVERLM